MLELKDWLSTGHFTDKPWLILGKGPTYSKIGDINLFEYNTLSLNHVVREQKVNIAHIIDIDVVESCASYLKSNCDWLIMPMHPHVSNRPSEILTLEDWKNSIPILAELDRQNKLIWYDLSLGEKAQTASEIEVHYFSSEAALGILAKMGVKTIRSLGVDGGKKYSKTFLDLDTETKLANGQPTFDLQFEKLEAIAEANNLDYRPIVEPMRVFVGADPSQLLAAKVLEYSIHKHASRPVRVIPMVDLPIPMPKDEKNRARTGFSFFRFAIPGLAKYRERALYLDSDMLVFKDLAELWDIEFGEQKVLCTTQGVPEAWKDNTWFHPGRQFSVMLLDCSRLNWKIEEVIKGLDEEAYTYAQLMFDFCLVKPNEIADRIPPGWNCLEHYEKNDSRLIHYTVIPTQPWTYDANPVGYLWEEALFEAVKTGWISRSEIEMNLEKGYLRKSLAHVLEFAKDDSSPGVTPPITPAIGSSARLQRLVKEWRDAVNEARFTTKQLMRTRAALINTQDRLEASNQELERFRRNLDDTIKTSTGVEQEYKLRVQELESQKQTLYSSKTWKLGRLITKPVELLRKK
jgi:lipopolysaccharide biosynthesis glycosyltransferase